FAVLATVRLFEGRWGRCDREGVAMAAIALLEGAVAVFFLRREGRRELGVLHSGIALTVVAIAAADLLSGSNLTYVWAAEAALLAWLSWRVKGRSFQVASLAYLALAAAHALVFEARPDHLFEVGRHPGGAIPSAVAVAAAAWFGATLVKALVFDGGELSASLRSTSFLAVGVCLLLAGYLLQLLDERLVHLSLRTVAASILALGLALSAVTTLVDG